MKLSLSDPPLAKFVPLIVICSLLMSCSGPAAGDPGAELVPDSEDGSLDVPKYLGFVDDEDNQPIAYAVVGGTEMTTDDGVASGDFLEYEGQWIPVEAPGYASSYAKNLVPLQGSHFFESRLTRYQTMAGMHSGGEISLSSSLDDEITLTVQITPDLFERDDVLVGLTAIDRLDVTPGRVAHRSSDSLRLRTAFAIQAFVDFWDPVQLASGAAIPLEIEFIIPLSDQAVFTTFDPIEGIWVEKDPDCSTEDGLIYTCKLPELNPLWAIFDQKENFMDLAVKQGGGLSSPAAQEAGNPQEDFNLAYDAWNQYMIDNLDDPAFDFGSPALLTLLSNLENAAKKFTENNRTETGKKVAIKGAEAADWSGNDAMSDSLFDEAGNIADEVFENLINEADCGEATKLIKGSEQFLMLSSNEDLSEQADEKLKEITGECDVWVGYIRVMMFTTTEHPAGLPLGGKGSSWWQEIHQIKIWTNVKNKAGDNSNRYVMHANDVVQLIFPPASYVEYDPCKSEIILSGSPGKVEILYEGFYDGITFQINSTTTEGEGGVINQFWEFNSEEDNNCVLDYSNNFSWAPYYSQIVHGLTSDSPPITLQEMLDEGWQGTSSLGDTINGEQEIINPDPEMGIYPFHEGLVTWRFIHVEKKLPLPAN